MAKTVGAGALLGANAVNGLTQSFMNNTQNVSRSDKDISFADALSQTSGADRKTDDSVRDLSPSKTLVNSQPKNVKEESVNTKDVNTFTDGEIKETADAALGKAEQVYDKVKEVLDVTGDELNEAMEVLALTMTDLLDGTNLQNLVMEVTGTTDTVSLITDVELYDKVKEITGFADELLGELSEETGIDKDTLLDFMANDESFADALTNVTNAAEDTEIVTEPDTKAADVNVSAEIPDEKLNEKETDAFKATDEQVRKLTEDSAENETVKTVNISDEKEKTESTAADNSSVEPANNEAKTETVKIEINGQKADNGKQNDRTGQNSEMPIMQAPQQTAVNMAADNIESPVESYTLRQAEEILRQVSDSIKVNITADSQSMEMQLHPASLGTVNMQINSVNGQITAHLTVQNELVKAVLESQLVKLQETFAEQGTKVEAIEVTVANYNLDSGMNNNTDNNESEGSRSGNTAKRRNINLNSDSAFDEFTDEEKLMADVMDMNGNSVDFSA